MSHFPKIYTSYTKEVEGIFNIINNPVKNGYLIYQHRPFENVSLFIDINNFRGINLNQKQYISYNGIFNFYTFIDENGVYYDIPVPNKNLTIDEFRNVLSELKYYDVLLKYF